MTFFDQFPDLLLGQWAVVTYLFLVVVGLILGILDRIGVPVRDLWPWFKGVRLKGVFALLGSLRSLQRLDDWWHWYRLKKGWREMKVDMSHLTEDLDVNVEPVDKKILVGITLAGGVQDIEKRDGAKIAEGNMITHIKDERDKDILRNFAVRDRARFKLFLVQLAGAVVDDWEGLGVSDGMTKTQVDSTATDRSEWIADYKIPSHVLMKYVGDLWDYEGQWSTE